MAADYAKRSYRVELNRDSVRNAISNVKINKVDNVYFINQDAGEYMVGKIIKKVKSRFSNNGST